MPRDVAIVLPGRPRRGKRNRNRHHGCALADLQRPACHILSRLRLIAGSRQARRRGRWTRGLILVGPLSDTIGLVDNAGHAAGRRARRAVGTIAAVRIGGSPALLVSDGSVVRAGRLFGESAARRWPRHRGGVGRRRNAGHRCRPTASVSMNCVWRPAEAEVFGRADLAAVIDTRRLPPGTRPTRLLLDVMVAPDGAGEKAVVSAFVNERLLGSTVAATGEATHLDLLLPDGLVGTIANVRVLDSARQRAGRLPVRAAGLSGANSRLLGAGALRAPTARRTIFPISRRAFRKQLEILLPAAAADRPDRMLDLVAEVAAQLSPEYRAAYGRLSPPAAARRCRMRPFIAVSDMPPAGATPRVRFDRGRVAVTDRAGRTLLDLGGFAGGAVAQIVTAGDYPGLWIKPLSQDQSTPTPADLHLDHGDVAFVDGNGVALAMSTERDTVVQISYPDQVSWLTVAERFRSWIIAGLWLFATAALLLVLQRMFRRRPANTCRLSRARVDHAIVAVRSRAGRSPGRPARHHAAAARRGRRSGGALERAARRCAVVAQLDRSAAVLRGLCAELRLALRRSRSASRPIARCCARRTPNSTPIA